MKLTHNIISTLCVSVDSFGLHKWTAGIAVSAVLATLAVTPARGQCYQSDGVLDLGDVGDVNGSGAINVADALCLVLENLAQLEAPVGAAPVCLGGADRGIADLDCSGYTDPSDVLLCIHRAVSGQFPVAADVDGNGCPNACTFLCADGDQDGVCDDEDLCVGDDSAGDVDSDGICDATLLSPGILNAYSALSADAASGSTEVPVVDLAPFQPGDRILVIQMQHATGAGLWELGTVASTSSGQLHLAAPLSQSYFSGAFDQANASAAQVVRVVRGYGIELVPGTYTAPAWNGHTGGIVAIESQSTMTFQAGAVIDVVAKGFRGAPLENTYHANGRVGEGVLGNSGTRCVDNTTVPDTGTGGCGAVEGTFNSSDGLSAAGGGANAGAVPQDGFAHIGRYVAKSGVPWYPEDASRMVLGGAGGQGDSGANDWQALAHGGNGGGMVFLFSAGAIAGAGQVIADGEGGQQGCNHFNVGVDWGVSGGGGGAGGSVHVTAPTLDDLDFSAVGGAGAPICHPYESWSRSHSGGAGRVVFDVSGAVSATSTPSPL